MDDAEIERLRSKNMTKVTSRGVDACLKDNEASRVVVESLLNGPHAKAVVLAILDLSAAAQAAMKRAAPIWQPFGPKENFLYELVTDRSDQGVRRVKNLLDAGWDPNLKVDGTQRTALMQVTNSWNPTNRDFAAMLLAAGANPDARSAGGQTALDFAPVSMRNFVQNFVRDIAQDTTNRTGNIKDAI
jgi:ankyrin repeat protein